VRHVLLLVVLLASMAILSMAVVTAPATRTTAADASPAATTAPLEELIASGDPRSDGEGPGIVGSPLAILLGVVVLGLLTASITVVVVRLRDRG
jgi:hypothetical protein